MLATGAGHPGQWRLWLVAAATAGAIGCKQTILGVLLAQLVWLYLERGNRHAIAHLIRVGILGAALAGLAIAQFGFERLWFGAVTVPRSLPMVPEILARFMEHPLTLAVQWVAPLLVIVYLGKRALVMGHPLKLPLLCWLGCLPLDIAGILSVGGSINSLHGFQLLVAPLMVFMFARANLRTIRLAAAAATIIAGLTLARIQAENHVSLLPMRAHMEDAMSIERQYPDEVWLPSNPLVSYYSEGRFYHTLDGLVVRSGTGFPITESQLHAHLPPRFHVIAFRPDGREQALEVIARHPHYTYTSGDWVLMQWEPDATP